MSRQDKMLGLIEKATSAKTPKKRPIPVVEAVKQTVDMREKSLEETKEKLDEKVQELKESQAFIENLQRQLDDYKKSGVPLLDTNTITFSRFEMRDATLAYSDEDFKALLEDLRKNKLAQPIKVRPKPNAPGMYEAVFGYRRHQVFDKLGLPIPAIIEDLSDEQMITMMHAENSHRKGISAIELGGFYAKVLKEIHRGDRQKLQEQFPTIDKASMSKFLAIAEIPEEVKNLFPDYRLLSRNEAYDLVKGSTERRTKIVETATRMTKPKPPVANDKDELKTLLNKQKQELWRRLVKAADREKPIFAPKVDKRAASPTLADSKGKPFVRRIVDKSDVTQIRFTKNVSDAFLEAVWVAIRQVQVNFETSKKPLWEPQENAGENS